MFEYKGLPLKWYIPTGVLFDLLCAEPERPWNLTVHFRGYPANVLTPCEGEDSIKWSFINSLKEAAYIINGNCKNVMNMSQADQAELWRSVLNGNLEVYTRVSSKLKLGIVSDEYTAKSNISPARSGQCVDETDVSGQDKAARVPVRLYVWSGHEDVDDLEDAPPIDTWDKISYVNQPVEIQEGKFVTLHDAVKSLLPEYFQESSLIDEESSRQSEDEQRDSSEDASGNKFPEDGGEILCEHIESCQKSDDAEIKLVRIQGIEPKLEIPFSWVANNLMNPDYFLHICVCLKIPRLNTMCM